MKTAIGEAPNPSAYRQVIDLSTADLVWVASFLSIFAPGAVIEALEALKEAKAADRA